MSDVGCPGSRIGLLRGDHVEGQETLATAWMLGVDREASQISQAVDPRCSNRVEPSFPPFSVGREIRL